MSDIITVASAIAADPVLMNWNPEVSYAPEFSLRDIETKRCVIVPTGTSYVRISRSEVQAEYQIEVGFLYRDKAVDMAAFLPWVQTFAKGWLKKTVNEARCVSATHDPLYSVPDMAKRNQLMSVVVLKFREVTL